MSDEVLFEFRLVNWIARALERRSCLLRHATRCVTRNSESNRANWIRPSDAPAPKAGALHPGRLPLRLAGALRHQPLQFLRRVVREPLHVSTEIGKELDHRPTHANCFVGRRLRPVYRQLLHHRQLENTLRPVPFFPEYYCPADLLS